MGSGWWEGAWKLLEEDFEICLKGEEGLGRVGSILRGMPRVEWSVPGVEGKGVPKITRVKGVELSVQRQPRKARLKPLRQDDGSEAGEGGLEGTVGVLGTVNPQLHHP